MPSESELARKEEVYAVVRLDHFHGDNIALRDRVTLREIVPTLEEAESEVARLQALNSSETSEYFVAPANWFPDGRGARAEY